MGANGWRRVLSACQRAATFIKFGRAPATKSMGTLTTSPPLASLSLAGDLCFIPHAPAGIHCAGRAPRRTEGKHDLNNSGLQNLAEEPGVGGKSLTTSILQTQRPSAWQPSPRRST